LNGGQLTSVEGADWNLISPYLQENQKLFGIKVEDLLRVEEHAAKSSTVYRKVEAIPLKALATLSE
jgi:FMN-dependent NADH-azoreductase